MVWCLLALKNILRRPVRSILTVLGVAIAIAVLFSLMEFQRGYEKGLKEKLGALGAHILVVPKGCPYEATTIVLHGGKWPRYFDERDLKEVEKVAEVKQTAGIIMDAIVGAKGGRENKIFMGIDEDYPKLHGAWKFRAGGWFRGKNSIILGAEAAAYEKLRVGDKFNLYIKEKQKSAQFTVSGVLGKTNTQDDGFYFLPLKTLQHIFELPGKLVVILVKLKDVEKVDVVAEKLSKLAKDINVFPLSELLSSIRELMKSTKIFVLAIVLVAVAISAAGVLNTILMTVFERTNEIGMMKAVGASRLDIFRLIWLETVLMCGAGGILGVGLALVSSKGVEAFIRAVMPKSAPIPTGTLISFSTPTFLICVAFSIILGILAGFYPAYRASSVKPIEAIRVG